MAVNSKHVEPSIERITPQHFSSWHMGLSTVFERKNKEIWMVSMRTASRGGKVVECHQNSRMKELSDIQLKHPYISDVNKRLSLFDIQFVLPGAEWKQPSGGTMLLLFRNVADGTDRKHIRVRQLSHHVLVFQGILTQTRGISVVTTCVWFSVYFALRRETEKGKVFVDLPGKDEKMS